MASVTYRKYKTLNDLLSNTIRTTTGCLEWQGYKDRNGYGRTYRDGRTGYKVHRLSMELAGYKTNGWVVCHKCDNPSCINPDHLFLGTMADNVHDAQTKGRFRVAKPQPPKRHMNRPALHGTKGGYAAGCKCSLCLNANAKYTREYRHKMKGINK